MDCISCHAQLTPKASYCAACGAPVIRERITAKQLLAGFAKKAFGWDSKFFITVRHLVVSPQIVLGAYLQGVRKKYSDPFAFFAIGAAISLLVISQFSEKHMEMVVPTSQVEVAAPTDAENASAQNFGMNPRIQEGLIKHWTLASFLLLPFYALIAFWVYGKPFNYGEHLVINAYIQGITFLMLTLITLLAIFTTPVVYQNGQVLILPFYMYAYGRLYQQSVGQVILSFLKFLGIMIALFLILFSIGLVGAMLSNTSGTA